ncbi:IS30 family transposase [Egibacter rhizosphaerae]|uniref:IS30 family transposase n=2 Tax=Egibacter rhizosphaerae TaxID=1670831 RepID=A0A411YLF6_9ACTN|nr:IS30 family transposase [Egibacter rhizosphaerae]
MIPEPAPRPCSARYLSDDERDVIAERLRGGASLRAIAGELGRAPSTVSREVRRNRHDTGSYRPAHAHRLATARRARPRPRRVTADAVLREAVTGMLDRKCSPEQISHTLRQRFAWDPSRQLTHESLYQALYDRDRPLGDRCRALRTQRRRRRPRPRGDARRPHRVRDMTPIAQRPAEVADRAEAGHWEGDLITGAANRSAIATLVERTTRYTVLAHLPAAHTAAAVRDAVTAALAVVPAHLRRSLTWDQGREMACHAQIAAATGMTVYVCDPHAPWQRPTNENANGLLRQYFPKGTNLARHCPEDLAAVQAELNDRPRKTLGWQSPAATFDQLQSTCQ